jgi:hypothetical protein
MKYDDRSLDAAFAAHKLEQGRRALTMTMAERLAWLEDALLELAQLRGLAGSARGASNAAKSAGDARGDD